MRDHSVAGLVRDPLHDRHTHGFTLIGGTYPGAIYTGTVSMAKAPQTPISRRLCSASKKVVRPKRLVGWCSRFSLEPKFAQTVSTRLEYRVFLTPKGDCKGLNVANETASGFEVHELGGGTSSVSFNYRIVALRKNFENIRLADHTNDPDPLKMMKKGTPTPLTVTG